MSNTPQQNPSADPQALGQSDITSVLIQHWAEMVRESERRYFETRDNYIRALAQIEVLEMRNEAMYQDNLEFHRLTTEMMVADAEKSNRIFRLQELILRMTRENPQLRQNQAYRDDWFAIVAGFTPDHPIDLTDVAADEVEL